MGVLKRKEERTGTITVRVPASVKAEFDQFRQRLDAAGFDLNATLGETLTRLAKQIREELEATERKSSGARPAKLNGLAHGATDGMAGKQA
jgi:hypothetical protein